MPGKHTIEAADGRILHVERGQRAPVRLIGGVNHMGIVSDSAAISVIADDVVVSRHALPAVWF